MTKTSNGNYTHWGWRVKRNGEIYEIWPPTWEGVAYPYAKRQSLKAAQALIDKERAMDTTAMQQQYLALANKPVVCIEDIIAFIETKNGIHNNGNSLVEVGNSIND